MFTAANLTKVGYVGLGSTAAEVWTWLRWPGAFLAATLAFSYVYYVTPDVEQRAFHWLTPGAVAGVLVWLLASLGLSAYLSSIGNIGALGQDSLKRLMGYSGIAQAGYMLAGVVVATETGLKALVFYLAAYMLMNLAIFAVIVARERETDRGDDIEALAGIGRSRPLLAWPITIGMLALAGLPGTSGFMGKLFLIEATVDGDYTWLGVVIVAGSMVSLVYYLRVIAAVTSAAVILRTRSR